MVPKTFITWLFSCLVFVNGQIINITDENHSIAAALWTKQCEDLAEKVKSLEDFNSVDDTGSDLASVKQFPYTVLIGYGKGVLALYLCGGTLITTRYVVSAAHCARHPKAGLARTAILGELDISTNNDETSVIFLDIISIVVHPNYKPNSLENNIALFRLERETPVSLYIRPVCLNHNEQASNSLWAPGWGANTDNPFLQSYHLKKYHEVEQNDPDCLEIYSSSLRISGTKNVTTCVTFKKSLNTCPGDSGGSLLNEYEIKGIKMKSLVGIRILPMGKCTSNSAVFIKVAHYLDWILEITDV